ncbi:Chemotaxis protein methyltransferase [Anaerobiospirillum thomasii]|uniref:protein-glutamate O-methyltransferase n=1 Tax=Anaerobiospirillum thomasii TaxID=179995 RepID=A0A2X0V9K4_9GAMM|nr:CheR family methyltransferase [Anaerobiospirillum thomasii]SPT69485.1 Chemotaxis protein methyltransferase [Anaerobiospirillum thomasii]SPT71960.1 Chemotaxis protein methyltransferase [Anaerobiospirillum thomasii]
MTDSNNSQDFRRPATAAFNTTGQGRLNSTSANIRTAADSTARPALSPRPAAAASSSPPSTVSALSRPALSPRPAATTAAKPTTGTFSYFNGARDSASATRPSFASQTDARTSLSSQAGTQATYTRPASVAGATRAPYTPPVSRATTSAPLSRSSVPEVSRGSLSSATSGEARATFTPSTFPGASALSIEAQKVGYARVMSSNPDAAQSTGGSLSSNSRIVTDIQYRRFAAYLEDQSGIVLGEGKQYLVNSRLSPLLNRFKVTTVDDLINKAMEPNRYKEISSAVIDAMTTNETLWFRDTYPYLALKNMILPELATKRKNPVRIWSAACSSGQEPFSIAMVVQEQVTQMVHVDPAQTQIVGTDISPEMLERCRQGLYDSHALARGLSAERKAKFFKPTNDPNQMKIDDKIKQMCIFKHMNLLSSYALLGKFDVIFCRNVLIYFNNEVKSQILNKFALSLNPGGYLILGSSESMSGLTDKYEMVRCNPGLAYRLKG